MPKIANSIEDLIGHTPILRLNKYSGFYRLSNAIYLKLESLNPTGSIKDRVALAVITQAEKEGRLGSSNVLIAEGNAGNFSVSLAAIAAAKGYKFIAVMPDNAPKERVALIRHFGAQVVLTPAAKGENGVTAKMNEIKRRYPEVFIPSLSTNPANANIHKTATADEIWKAFNGKIDIIVASVGTGGTLMGIGEAIKKKNKNAILVAVEPESPYITLNGTKDAHTMDDMGKYLEAELINSELVDEIVTVSNENAISAMESVAAAEGVLVGLSAGAAVYAATLVARLPENATKNILAIAPDSGEKYIYSGYLTEPETYITPL